MDKRKHHKAVEFYKVGFTSGMLMGIAVCIVIGKPLIVFPVLLALFFGAVCYQLKINDNENE